MKHAKECEQKSRVDLGPGKMYGGSSSSKMTRKNGQQTVVIIGAFVVISILSYYSWSLTSENRALKRLVVNTYGKLKDMTNHKKSLEKKNTLLSNRVTEMEDSRDTEKENADTVTKEKKEIEKQLGTLKDECEEKDSKAKICEDASLRREQTLLALLKDVNLEDSDAQSDSDIIASKIKHVKGQLKSIAADFQLFQDKYTNIEKEKIRLLEKHDKLVTKIAQYENHIHKINKEKKKTAAEIKIKPTKSQESIIKKSEQPEGKDDVENHNEAQSTRKPLKELPESPEKKTAKTKEKKMNKGKKSSKKEPSSIEGTKLPSKLKKRPSSDSKKGEKAKQNATSVPMTSKDKVIAVEIKKTDLETKKADEAKESDGASRKSEPTKAPIEGVEIPSLDRSTGTSSEKRDVEVKANRLASTASPAKKSPSKAVKDADETKLSADSSKKDGEHAKKVKDARSKETAEDTEQEAEEERDGAHKLAVAKEKGAGKAQKSAGKVQEIIDAKSKENSESEEQDSKVGLEGGVSGKKNPLKSADETRNIANTKSKHSDSLTSDDTEESEDHKEVVLKGLADDSKSENNDSEALPGMDTNLEKKASETLSKEISNEFY